MIMTKEHVWADLCVAPSILPRNVYEFAELIRLQNITTRPCYLECERPGGKRDSRVGLPTTRAGVAKWDKK